MITLVTKYWKVILDIILVIALVVAVFLWNPFDLFGKEVRLQPTANVASQIRQIGQLVTAEYYGEVVASLGETKLNFLKEDFLNQEADSIYVALKADVFDAYMALVIEATKDIKRANKRERKKKKARKDAVEYLVKNYGNNLLGKKRTTTYVNDTMDIVLLFIAEKVLNESTSMDLDKLDKDKKRRRFREKQLGNLLAEIEHKHLTLDEKAMDLYLQQPLDEKPSFSSFYYSLYQKDEKRKDQLAMIGRGSVKAGFDFGSFEESHLYMDSDAGIIHIFGLEPVILDFDINPWFIPQKAVPGYDIIQAGRNVSFDDAKKVKSYCRAKLRSRALEAGIISEAQRYGEEVIKTFLTLVLETEVKQVVFHENLENVFLKQITKDGIIHHTEIVLIESAERQFLQKVEQTTSKTLKQAYLSQLRHFLFKLREYPLQLADQSQISFNYFTKELYSFLSDSTLTDPNIRPENYVKIDTSYRWGIDSATFISEEFKAHSHWFYDSLTLNKTQFTKDYNDMLDYLHRDEREDTLINPIDLKYICIAELAIQDSLTKADTLDLDLFFQTICTTELSAQQMADTGNYRYYLNKQHKFYLSKSWISKLRENIEPQSELKTLRSKLEDSFSFKN